MYNGPFFLVVRIYIKYFFSKKLHSYSIKDSRLRGNDSRGEVPYSFINTITIMQTSIFLILIHFNFMQLFKDSRLRGNDRVKKSPPATSSPADT